MAASFYENIKPHVMAEITAARECRLAGRSNETFRHLEIAHILGQESTRLHVLAHGKMMRWSIDNRDLKEFLGQIVRLVGAALLTRFGFIPVGNSGGTNVNATSSMPLEAKHAEIIEQAKNFKL